MPRLGPSTARALISKPPNLAQGLIRAKRNVQNSPDTAAHKRLLYFEHPHLGDLDLGTPGSRCWGWALQGDCGVGHSREIESLGWARSLALQGLWAWALQGTLWSF